MKTKDFVKEFHCQMKNQLEVYFNSEESTVSQKIKELESSGIQKQKLHALLQEVLIDTYYSTLLGLVGESSIGNLQQAYKIVDEEGNDLDMDEISEHAWNYFQEN